MKFFHSISFRWMIAAVFIAVIAAHLELAFFSRHIALTTSLASILLVVLLALHLGIAGPAYVLFRRWSRK
jgi:hypothetical protein